MKKRALTLVEVIVVVAIIIVLAAIMIPILGKTKQKGSETAAIATLKSFAQALALYRADYQVGPSGAGSLASTHGFPHTLQATNAIEDYGFIYQPCDPGCVEPNDLSRGGSSKCPWILMLPPSDSIYKAYGESFAIMGGMCFTDPSIPFGNFSFPHTGIGIRADHSLIRYTKPGNFGSRLWWHDQEPEEPEQE